MQNQGKTILILSDHPEDILTLNLQKEDVDRRYVFVTVLTLKEAAFKLRENVFHAIVADFYLQDGLGIDLIPFLGKIPLIILLEEGNEENAVTSSDAGAFSYLVKDSRKIYLKLLPVVLVRSIEQNMQQVELGRYRTQLENIVEERTNELIDMYSKLQESETNFRNIFQSTSDGMIITDYHLQFLEANDSLFSKFGVTREFLSTSTILDYLVPAFRTMVHERMALIAEGIQTGNLEVEIRSPLDNRILPYEIASVPIIFNRKEAILTIMRDITERKYLSRKLFETIIQTEEEERSRIARDLHDEIGPLISALKIFTTSFIETTNPDKKNKLAGQMGGIIRELIDSVKNISNDMSPHILVNFGLHSAILGIINLFSKNVEFHFATNLSGMRFSPTVESVVYRIFKELANNTIKHAKACNIFINIDYTETVLVCNYRDDGIGFDWPYRLDTPNKGMGINNIVTRIKSLGGEFEIHTAPGEGFEINFAINVSLNNTNGQ